MHIVVLDSARARALAWRRVLDALSEQRDALQHRIWLENISDIHLEADCRVWCELARSLANFLEARRSA
jgi:hypothetical protein